jgi:UDP-N-acetyl-D-mannosaminuronic acid dehydrogenase
VKNLVIPHIEKKSGLKAGSDFALAACPERILEGRAIEELQHLPEIVGGVNEVSNTIFKELFKKINSKKTILFTTPTGAEIAKLYTNIYRYVSFALANEFAIWAEMYGEDAHEIIKIANYDYSRSNIPTPGFAGGPCLGKDTFLLDNNTTFISIISTAWKLNEAVPQHVVESIRKRLGILYGKKISVLGLAYKASSDDTRLSPCIKLVEILKSYGAIVQVHDPYVPNTSTLDEVMENPDIVIIAINHPEFIGLSKRIDNIPCKLVYDVWGIYSASDFHKASYMRFGGGN